MKLMRSSVPLRNTEHHPQDQKALQNPVDFRKQQSNGSPAVSKQPSLVSTGLGAKTSTFKITAARRCREPGHSAANCQNGANSLSLQSISPLFTGEM